MRGPGNQIKKPDKINKIMDNSKLLNFNLASNNTDSSNGNNQTRKNTCSQDQTKKSKAYSNINTKMKSQNNTSPLTANLNNLIITNHNYSNTGNFKINLISSKNSNIPTIPGKKSYHDNSQSNIDIDSNNEDRSKEKNLTADNNDFKINLKKSKDIFKTNLVNNNNLDINFCRKNEIEIGSFENNKDSKNPNLNSNEKINNNSKNNFKKNNLYLENVFDHQSIKSPIKSEKRTEIKNVKESSGGIKNKFKLDKMNNMNLSKEIEEIIYPGKLTENNAVLRITDNPFTVNPNYKAENSNEAFETQLQEVNTSENFNYIPKEKTIFDPTKENKNNSICKNAIMKQQQKIGNLNENIIKNTIHSSCLNFEEKDSKSHDEREIYHNNILLTSNSNVSPNSNKNLINLNNFNKNYKKGYYNKIDYFKENSKNDFNKCHVINLNDNLKNDRQVINTENKEENFIIQTNSNSISPNNFLNSFRNQNKNNGYCSTTNSATSNVMIGSNFQNQVCYTVENDCINKEEAISVNYCNTNPNDYDKNNLLKFNRNANFNFTKIKENNGDKFSLKNNSLNKILQNMKGNNAPYSVNNQSTVNNIYNINGTTNSNILSTNHTDNNILLNSNNNFSNNFKNKSNKESNEILKKDVINIHSDKEKPLKKSIHLDKKDNEIKTWNYIRDLKQGIKNLIILNKDKNDYSNSHRKSDINNKLNKSIKENEFVSKKISFNNYEESNKEIIIDSSNKQVTKYVDNEEKKENNEKILFNTRDNPNRHSSNIEKSKFKKNSFSNNTHINMNNTQNIKIFNANKNKISKELEKNNNMISSYNNKNQSKNKNLKLENVNNLYNDNVLKNFNYVSIGYLDNPLVNSGAFISKDKSKTKNIENRNKKKFEEEKKIDNSNQGSFLKNNKEKIDLLNSNPIKDMQSKLNSNKLDLISKIDEINIKESNNAYGKLNNNDNIQNFKIGNSLNTLSKKNHPKYSLSKIKKENMDKNNCHVNISNKIIVKNKNTITSKISDNVISAGKNANQFIKKDVCRIFNSDDFYERNKSKHKNLQEVTNSLNNIKLNSLYSKNLSQKINQSKNIQINLYNNTNNELDPQKLYNLDFNSNLKTKEKTIIIDDIEELEDESYKYTEKKPNNQPIKEERISDTDRKIYNKDSLIPSSNNKLPNDNFKSDILHSILNFKGFFKENDQNNIDNIYKSQDCMNQINKLNEKLEKLKNTTEFSLNPQKDNKSSKLKEDDCIVKIKESPQKPEIMNLNSLGLVKDKSIHDSIKKLNNNNNPKKIEANREYYYFQKENSFNKDKMVNKESKDYLNSNKNDKELVPKDKTKKQEHNKKSHENFKSYENHIELTQKSNIMNEIHFNSDVRMKRYEILLEFINTNMKEIGKMVSGEQEICDVKKSNENDQNPDMNNKNYSNQNQKFDARHKINYSKNEEFADTKNIHYTSYVNSLKKIEETNSNKVSSLHSKINLNSRLSNNDFNFENSEMKESNNLGEDNNMIPDLMESNFTNHFKEQINNISLMLNFKKKEINDKNNIVNYNEDKQEQNLTNQFEYIHFHKNKKDPGSSLLLSSIYSDFNHDLIDESFNNNVLNLVNNQNQQSKIFQNGFFSISNPLNLNNQNEIINKKESIKIKNEINKNDYNFEIKKIDSKTNLLNLNSNKKQSEIINNIITINNNYNRSKQQLNIVNDSKCNINQAWEKTTIPVSKSKGELTKGNLNNYENKTKNNLDKNLLTLISNNNINKMTNQNACNPNIPMNRLNNFPRSEITKTNIISENVIQITKDIKNTFSQNQQNADRIIKNSEIQEKNLKSTNFEKKDSSEMIIEIETNINLIKNIDNNFNNINAINNKTTKQKDLQNKDQRCALRAIQTNLHDNLIKLDQKNIIVNKKIEEKNQKRINPNNLINQMSPSRDSDRTVVQFFENKDNLDIIQMNSVLGKKKEINHEYNSSKTNNVNVNSIYPDVLKNEENTTQNGKYGNALLNLNTNTTKTEKILEDDINKEKPKCSIF